MTHIARVARYAIGDVQGCYDSLTALLGTLPLGDDDEIWLVGDLVNRGPRSIDVLRWARDNDRRVRAVLGNHDLHLLAMAVGVRSPKKRDTARHVLDASDGDDVIDWLRTRPLLHRDGDFTMVHAGVHPAWTMDETRVHATAVETALRSDDWKERLAAIYATEGDCAADDLSARCRGILDILTTIRCVAPDGAGWRLDRLFDGPPAEAPAGHVPWFEARGPHEHTLVFGHWAALGYHRLPGYIALDTGCVWGGELTCVRLEDGARFSQRALEQA